MPKGVHQALVVEDVVCGDELPVDLLHAAVGDGGLASRQALEVAERVEGCGAG